MRGALAMNLHARELSTSDIATRPRSHLSKLYADRRLIADLDIVNELDGHSGCVNALSWSKSGRLLASGSDDQHLNIHTYQPEAVKDTFRLSTTVATGHTQNIFSVKFMPHHNDRTLVTAAGDGEVRIFDLEYAGQNRAASAASSVAAEGRKRGRNRVYSGVTYLSDGDTDARVYRSHGDRVKRIVTESSPHLFLTCSEDGEVRQWDLRQPSSAYPARRGTRHGPSFGGSEVPPPLISYKRYNLDLNTISCSPSQPHYIALGGAHVHAFLHDRRMTGRDRLREAGKPLSPAASRSPDDEELMSQATQCVRKFAPKGQQRMKRTETGHITACKISDARPDEMVVSWSGDHIYSFDLVRSPDASEDTRAGGSLRKGMGSKTKGSRDRKRKRTGLGSETSLGGDSAARANSRPRTEDMTGEGQGAALRVRYLNGQSEDIPIQREQARPGAQDLNERERLAWRIAESTALIRSSLFRREAEGHQFSTVLGEAASSILDIDELMREWRYPLDPLPETVIVQQTLRRHRESTRRFAQAAGTLARVIGGKLRTGSADPSPLLAHFSKIEARSNDLQLTNEEHFSYDFLKAILLWLESGIGRLIEGFTRPPEMSPSVKAASRLPIPESEASTEAIDDILIPYLLRLASDKPIVNIETNQFEHDENRQLFATEKQAILAFAAAVRIPFADLSSAIVLAEGGESVQAQDRQTAMRFWGMKAARGVLLNTVEGVNFGFVVRAFGGSESVVRELQTEGEGLGRSGADEEEGEAVESVEVMDQDGGTADGAHAEDVAAAMREAREGPSEPEMPEEVSETGGDLLDGDAHDEDEDMIDDDEHDDGLLDPDEDDDEDDDTSEPDEEDGVPNLGNFSSFMSTSAFERRRRKEKVEALAPCYPYTRVYRGHCNVRTVKDVNYFGLDDEYVVSGSDDGNLFMWCRKSGELVNVLEGDGEVVNVVQGHPYETMLAVSGIDHTIKIFSPDARARAAARLGDGVNAHDASQFSSLAYPPRMGRRVPRRGARRDADDTTAQRAENTTTSGDLVTSEPAFPSPTPTAEEQSAMQDDAEEEDEAFVAPNGLASRKRMHDAYRIMNNNDVERKGGAQDAGGYVMVRDLHPLLLLLARGGGLG